MEELQPRDEFTVDEDQDSGATVSSAELGAEQDVVRGSATDGDGGNVSLPELLADEQGELFHDVWDLYCRLEPDKRPFMQTRVVQYLSRSQSVVETGRALSLFRQIPVEQWDNGFLLSAVLVLLRAGQQEQAIEEFKKGLHLKGLLGGFEYLLIDTVSKQEWAKLLDAWLAYSSYVHQNSPGETPPETLLEPLRSLENLGALYFSFERYLAADEMRVERWLNLEPPSRVGLKVLRRKFATEALRAPCPPKQASVILSFWRDPEMYERYLCRMIDAWYHKRIPDSTARMLPAIYEDLKALPGAKPSREVMKGVFKIHYPTGADSLETLYDDWIRVWGDLDRRGYESFLKFFAHRANVDRVRELWARYVERFPSALKTPRGFRSTMNAYAQAGDARGAEGELDLMVNRYKVKPDVDTWNTLLKCYMRAGDYSKVLSCFQEICNNYQPDSYTYAHVMAMCSKKGDLDQTIRFFNRAQEANVPISKEMVLSLVVAYCQNDMLLEAEKICRELTLRGVTSSAIWNELIHFNGMQGRLDKCYELLNAMRQFNLEWDQDTLSYLLDALVRVNQVVPAYHVIRDSLRNRLHVLRPEHFAVAMLGAFRTGNHSTAESLVTLMEKASMPTPFNATVEFALLSLQKTPNSLRTSAMGRQVLTSLQALVNQKTGDVRRLKLETRAMGRAVQLLVQFRDFVGTEELMSLFIDLFPEYRESKVLPPDVLTSLMLAYHNEGDYEQVLELWRGVWPRILRQCSTLDGRGIYPSHRYDVTRLVHRLAETYKALGDGDGLLECVERVTAAGFRLTSATWDRVICNLAHLGKWERAMDWCETMLMPEWRGWNRVPKPLSQRRLAFNPRLLQPTSRAVLALQREWLEVRRLSAWSVDMARKLVDVEQRYPMLHRAFLTSGSDKLGVWILRDDLKLSRAIDELLRPLPLEELRAMEKVLKRQLAAEERADRLDQAADAEEARFRVLNTPERSSRALDKSELKLLRSLLLRTLRQARSDGSS